MNNQTEEDRKKPQRIEVTTFPYDSALNSLRDYTEITPKVLRDCADEMEKLNIEHVELLGGIEWDVPCLYVYYYRHETLEEVEKRIQVEDKKREMMKQWAEAEEKEQYLKLKEKFEKE